MSELTEQWKKGELPCGWYWCNCYDEETKLLYYNGDCFELDDPETKNYYFFLLKDIEEITILAPFPSYEEWQASEKYNKHLEEVIKIYERKDKQATETSIAYNELLEENTKLKELLKKHRDIFARTLALCIDLNFSEKQKNQFADDIAEIDQALGEDK